MALQASSFHPHVPPTPRPSSAQASQLSSSAAAPDSGDGFTGDERHSQTRSLARDCVWTPRQEYQESDIADLAPGPGNRCFMGRIVNFFDQTSASKMPRAAKGCVKMTVKDDTGVISVRLWYAGAHAELRLGQLVTVWTPHISKGEYGNLAPSSVPLLTSIFPERDRGCNLMVHENSDDGKMCKMPLEYRPGRALSGLLTLQNFVDGGYEVADCRILVAVRWVAAKKAVTTQRGEKRELVNVGVFDNTADATLMLWGPVCASAGGWRPSHTMLLVTRPGCTFKPKASISLNSNTMVEVDPETEDANWLRGFASRLTRREHVNPDFPRDTFDFESLECAQLRIKYTLADLDEFARAAPSERFLGFMNVMVTELRLVLLQRRNMLMCNECCGIPSYANVTTCECKQCGRKIDLRVNPRVLGLLVDETGSITSGKLSLSDKAWMQLLGHSMHDLAKLPVDALNRIEQRLIFSRITLVFGWTAEEAETGVGRICVGEILS